MSDDRVRVTDDREGGPPRRDAAWLPDRAKALVGALIAILYAVGMSLRGDVLPGIVGGILAGILCFLVLREVERQRAARRR